MALPNPPPVRIPLSWPYNNRADASPNAQVDAYRINVIDEPKDGGGFYVLKRPGMTFYHQFISGIGQAIQFYNGTLFAVTNDNLQSVAVFPTGADGTAWTTGATAPWAPRTDFGLLSMNGVMYLMGGVVLGSGAASDVWWSIDGLQWTQATGAAPWEGRSSFGAVVLNNLLYIMGGLPKSGTADSQVWSSSDGTTWTEVTATAPWSGRVGMGAVATSNGIFVLGGLDTTATYKKDVWFSANGKDWAEVNVSGTTWSGRADMMCWVYQNKIFIAGGGNGAGPSLNDCWSSSDGGQTWTQLTAAAFSVGGLAFAGAVVYQNKMWAINGRIDIATRSRHVYSSTDGITWTNVTATGPGVATQEGAATVFASPASTFGYETMWYMGGTDGVNEYNIPYYANLNVTPSTSNPLSPPFTGEPFQLQSFVEGQKMLVKNQNALWVYDHGVVTRVTDQGYPAQTVPGLVVLGGFAYVMTPDGLIRNSDRNDPYHWPSENNIGADYADDPGVALAKYQNYVVAFGTYTTQFFYDAGNPTGSPLSVYLNSNMLIGLADAASLAEVGNTLVYVSQTKQLHRQVVFLNGTTPQVISTPYIEKMIANAGVTTLSAFSCSTEGHLFYVLSVGNLLWSLAYDFSTKEWQQWNTPLIAGSPGQFNFVGQTTFFGGITQYILGPFDGKSYLFQSNVYGDNGTPFDVTIATPKIDAGNNRKKFWGQCEIIADRGIQPPHSPTYVSVEYSDDDYASWSTPRLVDLSAPRPVLYRNGSSRRRAYRLKKSDLDFMRLESIEQTLEQGQ